MTLLSRLEAATGADRNLDALIECEVRKLQAYALGLSDKVRSHWHPIGDKGEVICTQGITRYHAPMYSFSIDAAMTLVRPGLSWAAGDRNEDDQPWACLTDQDGTDFAATGATPIIAICIAALKAREVQS